MNYYKYYISSAKAIAQSFRLGIKAYLSDEDYQVVHQQTLIIRAKDLYEAKGKTMIMFGAPRFSDDSK